MVLVVLLGMLVGIAGGLPFAILLVRGTTKYWLVLATVAISLLAFMAIVALAASQLGRAVIYFAGALALAFLATVIAGAVTKRCRK